MYTQCPDCSAAFRVTAGELKQAAGKVRCGGCGSAFDALEFLSEEMPEQPPTRESLRQLPELKPARRASGLPEKISPEESIALLKTLDELAGSDIRVEDTGIEWRVLDDQVIAELETADAADEQADAKEDTDDPLQSDIDNEVADEAPSDPGEAREEPTTPDEPRYDDDTPLPEDHGDDESAAARDEDKPGDETLAVGTPDDESEPQPDELDIAFDDDETGDWEEILDEFDEPDTSAQEDNTSDKELPRPVDDDDTDSGDDATSDETDDEAEGLDEGLDHSDETDNLDEHADRNDQSADPYEDEAQDDQTDDVDTDPDGDVETDDDLVDDERLPDVQEEPVEVESIIMEGETVRNALDELAEGEQPADADIAYWVPPDDDVAPARSSAAKFGTSLAAVLLLLLLALQVVHYYRDTLATIPAIQRIIAPLYRSVGLPLSPDWDVTAWRFEATQGNSDSDDELIVYSRIGNTSGASLPYPLIGISLTDRFDETVGSRLLEPQEFLPEGANPRRMVPAGTTFDAVISIKSPDTSATGYKLNVCYRSTLGAAGSRLRCAIGDFKQ